MLKLAIDRISISIKPPSHVQSNISKSSKFALQRTVSIIKDLLTSIPQYQWCGIVTQLEFPSKSSSYNSAIEAITPVSDKLVNIDRSSMDLASFQLQFGMKENSFFTTYTISGYETRDMKLIPKDKVGFVTIGPADYMITECGIRIMLDINNNPGGATEDPIMGDAMVLSHSCEIDPQNKIKLTSIILAPLRDINTATAPDKIQDLIESNEIDRTKPQASYLKYFYVPPNENLKFKGGAIVDCSKCFSLRRQSYKSLLSSKIVQLSGEATYSMALKLALYFHRNGTARSEKS